MSKTELIISTYKANPDWSNRKIAQELNVSRRHVRRTLNHIRGVNTQPLRIPKILLLDIETVMMEVFVWFLGKQRIPYQNVIKEWNMLSWAGKWLFSPEIIFDVQTSKEAIDRDDKRIVSSLYQVINDADIIVGHNLNRFDIRKVNTRLLYHGFSPTKSFQTIDTLTVMKRHFSMSSYRLDDICKFLGLPIKIHTGYDLWKQCLEGKQKSLDNMSTYNQNDVLILEELYLRVRGWIKSHPNCALYVESDTSLCGNCASDNLMGDGRYYTPAGRFVAYRCDDCGAVCRSRYSDLTKEERENLLISVAR